MTFLFHPLPKLVVLFFKERKILEDGVDLLEPDLWSGIFADETTSVLIHKLPLAGNDNVPYVLRNVRRVIATKG